MANPGENKTDYKWSSIYRALVVDAHDETKRGRVKVWSPDLMPEIEPEKGLWARPANTPVGGRNSDKEQGNDDHFFQGSCMIPSKGSWTYIFFEQGNPNEPRYLAGGDFGQTKVPIENQQGTNFEKKWTLYKSREGRTVIISDDPADARVEITGKKRNLTSTDPSGNPDSVYTVDGNQTVILLDESTGSEKILIKTYKGDFINLDVKARTLNIQMENDIKIKTNGNLLLDAAKGIHMKSGEDFNIASDKNINIKAETGISIESATGIDIKSNTDFNMESVANLNIKATAIVGIDGATLMVQSGSAGPASPSTTAPTAPAPDGERPNPGSTQGDADSQPANAPALPETVIHNEQPSVR